MKIILILSLICVPLALGCEKQEPGVAEKAPAAAEKTKPAGEVKGGKDDKEKPKAKGKSLFNGKDLKGWEEVNFGGEGEVLVEDGTIVLGFGETMTAILYDGKEKLPKTDYEISLEAKKLMGNDFFCGLTFPVRDDHATLIVGGWGGAVVGISSLDGFDASENETAQFMAFDDERWYKIRLRLVDERITVWIDDKEMIGIDIQDRELSMRPGEIELCKPLGIASYQTRTALRNIRLRKLKPSGDFLK